MTRPRAPLTLRLPLPGERTISRRGQMRVLLVFALAISIAALIGQRNGLALARSERAWALQSQAWRYAKTLTACSDVLALAAQMETRPGWWTVGTYKNSRGYVFQYSPGHPRATNKGLYVYKHVLVAEELLGRALVYIRRNHPDNEVVHHIDGNNQQGATL